MATVDEIQSIINQEVKQTRIIYRYVVTALMFFGLVIMQMMRVDLSVAIVAMVNHNRTSNVPLISNDSNNPCHYSTNTDWTNKLNEKNLHKEGFDWDEITQGKILGAYSYGMLIAQFIGGFITDLIGVKVTFGVGILFSSILTFISPVAASQSYSGLIVVRTLLGLSQGVLIPCMSCCVSRWIPKHERTFLHGIMRTGNNIGAMIATQATGFISNSSVLGGWPTAFYIFGTVGLVWCIVWCVLMFEHPSEHRHISPKELHYISTHMQAEGHHTHQMGKKKVPWKAVAKSYPIWVCAAAMFATSWGANTFNNHVPIYFANILKINLDSNAVLSSLHFLFAVVVIVVTGRLADWLYGKGHLSDTNIRKLFAGVGNIIGPILLIGVTFAGCGSDVIVGLITAGSALIGASYPSLEVAIINMSPTHSGTISGIVSGIGDISGFLSAYVVGELTQNNETFAQWNKVFYISAAIIFGFSLPFFICGKSELQSWSVNSDSDNPDQLKHTTDGATTTPLNEEEEPLEIKKPHMK